MSPPRLSSFHFPKRGVLFSFRESWMRSQTEEVRRVRSFLSWRSNAPGRKESSPRIRKRKILREISPNSHSWLFLRSAVYNCSVKWFPNVGVSHQRRRRRRELKFPTLFPSSWLSALAAPLVFASSPSKVERQFGSQGSARDWQVNTRAASAPCRRAVPGLLGVQPQP